MVHETAMDTEELGEFTVAMNKTWTRIGMGKVALANSLNGRSLFTPEEVALLARAVMPNQ